MANTTFAGTVRAESGLKGSAKAAATGAYTDKFTVSCAGAVCVGSTLAVTGRSTLTGNTIATTAGTGITSGSGTVYAASVIKTGGIYHTKILIDLTGLASSGSGDIIGKAATANCHIGQITAAVNGTVLGGKMTCLEAPGGGDPDINLWYADEATGTEDAIPIYKIEVDETTYNSLDDSKREIVYCYNWEVDRNEAKRDIKMIDRQYASDILSEHSGKFD